MTKYPGIARIFPGLAQTFERAEDVNAMLAKDMRALEDDAKAVGLPTPPRVLPATEQLRTNLERAALAYANREQTLQREIADREAELVDVRRARDAATAGLLELEGEPELDADDADAKQVAAFGGTYPGAPLPAEWANERRLINPELDPMDVIS